MSHNLPSSSQVISSFQERQNKKKDDFKNAVMSNFTRELSTLQYPMFLSEYEHAWQLDLMHEMFAFDPKYYVESEKQMVGQRNDVCEVTVAKLYIKGFTGK